MKFITALLCVLFFQSVNYATDKVTGSNCLFTNSRYFYDVIEFSFGSDSLIIEGLNQNKLDSIIDWISKNDKNSYRYLFTSNSCNEEIEKYPNLGIIRAKKVISYLGKSLADSTVKKFYIDPKNYPIHFDCSVPKGISITLQFCD